LLGLHAHTSLEYPDYGLPKFVTVLFPFTGFSQLLDTLPWEAASATAARDHKLGRAGGLYLKGYTCFL